MVIKCQIKGDCYSKKVPVGGEGVGRGQGSTVAHLQGGSTVHTHENRGECLHLT